MHNYMAVVRSDVKNTYRDPSLLVIFVAPLLIILLVRFGFPFLLNYVPKATDYSLEIVSFFALLCSVMPAFAMAFILLDEKDIQLFPVIKVTPVSLSGFLLVRIFLLMLLGFVLTVVVLIFNGIYVFQWQQIIGFSVLAALNSPIVVMLISHFAKNKIEGATLLKAANVLLIIPILVFFFDAGWEYALCIFPSFWAYKFLDASNCLLIFVVGIVFLIGLNALIFRFVVKRN